MYLCPKCSHDSFVEKIDHCIVARLVDGNLKPVKVFEIEPTGDSVIAYECMGCGARWSREDIELCGKI